MTTTKHTLVSRHPVAASLSATTPAAWRVSPDHVTSAALFVGVARATLAFGTAVAHTAAQMHGTPDPITLEPAILRSR